jgi:hypothetical protein
MKSFGIFDTLSPIEIETPPGVAGSCQSYRARANLQQNSRVKLNRIGKS